MILLFCEQCKHGHRAAIRSLAFDKGENLLLGAGVEGEVRQLRLMTLFVRLVDDCSACMV